MIKFLVSIATLLLTGVFCVYVGLYFYQAKLIFYPVVTDPQKKLSFGVAEFSENFLEINSTTKIHYLIFPQENSKGTILYFHGNAGNLESWGYAAAELSEKTGFDVWIMDYPGYGKSTPVAFNSEQQFFEMGHQFVEFILNSKPQKPLFLFGRSIGSGIASELATTEKVSGLVLETPYTTLKDLVRKLLPWVPPFLVRFDFNNLKLREANLAEKTLILHGTADEVIPFAFGENLAKALPNAKFVSVKGGHHNDLSSYPEYWPAVTDFFSGK